MTATEHEYAAGDSIEKVGQFTFPATPKGFFHLASDNPAKMSLHQLRVFSCESCHDDANPLPFPERSSGL